MVLALGSPHGRVPLESVEDPATKRALMEMDTAITDLEDALRKARINTPLGLRTYTVATLPPAADHPWTVVAVTDGGAGAEFRGSNGVAWVNLG